MPKIKLSKRLILFLRLLVSFSILFYLFIVIDWNNFFLILSEIKLEYAWLSPFFLLLGLYFAAIRWQWLLLYFDIFITKLESFIYYLIANFYSILLPGVLGGDVIRIGMCAFKQNSSITSITTSALLERVLGVVSIFSMGTISVLFLSTESQKQLGISFVLILPIIELSILTFLLLIWLFIKYIKADFFDVIEQKFNTKYKFIARFIYTLKNLISQLQKIPFSVLLGVTLLSFLFQFSDIIASYFLAKAISIKLPFLLFLVILPLTYISTILPISLGGLGVREGVLSFFLNRLGVETSDAVAYSFILYLNRTFIAIIGGITQVIWKRFS